MIIIPDYYLRNSLTLIQTLKVNKSFPGLGQSDRFVTTKDYRVVLTLRRITKSDAELNVLNVDKFLTTKVKETETQTELPQGQLSLFDKNMLISLENYLLSVLDRKSKVILDKTIPKSVISNIVNNLSKRSIGYTVSHIGDKLTISKNPSALGKTNFNTLSFWKYIVDDLRYSTIDDEFKNGIKDNISKHFKVEEITKYGKDDFAFISTLTFGDKLYNLTENELQGMIREVYIEKTGTIPKITVVKSFKMYELRENNKIENLKHVIVNSLDYTKHTGIELEGNIFEITSSKSLKSMYDDIKSINRKNSNNKTILSLGYDAEGGLFYTNKDKHSDLYNLINDFYNETKTAQLRDVTKVNNLVNAIKNGQLYIAHDGTFDKLMQVYFSNMLNKKTLVTKKDINNNYFLDIKPKTDFIDKPLEDEMVKNLRERLEKYVIGDLNDSLSNEIINLNDEQYNKLKEEFANNEEVTKVLNLYKCK